VQLRCLHACSKKLLAPQSLPHRAVQLRCLHACSKNLLAPQSLPYLFILVALAGPRLILLRTIPRWFGTSVRLFGGSELWLRVLTVTLLLQYITCPTKHGTRRNFRDVFIKKQKNIPLLYPRMVGSSRACLQILLCKQVLSLVLNMGMQYLYLANGSYRAGLAQARLASCLQRHGLTCHGNEMGHAGHEMNSGYTKYVYFS
jgi:hypothetical protein